MCQNTSRLDRPVGAEDIENRGGSCGAGNRANPQRTSRSGLQLSIQASKARTGTFTQTVWGGCARIRDSSALRGCNWSTVGLSKPDSYRLSIGHTNVASETVQNIILCTDSIRLINKIDKATLLCQAVSVILKRPD